MRLAIIIGSIREGRQSQKAAYFLQKKLTGRLIDTDIIDLAEEISCPADRYGYY